MGQASISPGSQFITGPCSGDSDCASTCCEQNQNVCRAFLSLSSAEACKDGRTPGEQGFVAPGTQFITGLCSADSDCASTCCEQAQNVCRAFLSLNVQETCKDGRAPRFSVFESASVAPDDETTVSRGSWPGCRFARTLVIGLVLAAVHVA